MASNSGDPDYLVTVIIASVSAVMTQSCVAILKQYLDTKSSRSQQKQEEIDISHARLGEIANEVLELSMEYWGQPLPVTDAELLEVKIAAIEMEIHQIVTELFACEPKTNSRMHQRTTAYSLALTDGDFDSRSPSMFDEDVFSPDFGRIADVQRTHRLFLHDARLCRNILRRSKWLDT